ncbi:hypothetical protein BTUL_0064g00400 [Botrytis tulipae]|uniref:Uncharacterized protein n=1 Tax=Botrytis tulipae TaxID=87230 RepID=A0A4Z1EQY2_9HELO|nr:hypothetical protein BTUL_0064g00400 [Botrytis tulipae]
MSESESHTSGTAGKNVVIKGKSVSLFDAVSREIFQFAASDIGLAAETIHNRKQRKGKAAEPNESQSHIVEDSDEEVSRSTQSHDHNDHPSSHMQQQTQEATCQLDEAQDQVNFEESPPSSYEKAANGTEGPAANEGEIFQTANSLLTFLDFIDNFNKAVRTNSLIQVLSLVSIAGLAAPDHIGILIDIAVQVVTNIADEIDSCSKIISFLDKVIDSFFAPRGLIALIIS